VPVAHHHTAHSLACSLARLLTPCVCVCVQSNALLRLPVTPQSGRTRQSFVTTPLRAHANSTTFSPLRTPPRFRTQSGADSVMPTSAASPFLPPYRYARQISSNNSSMLTCATPPHQLHYQDLDPFSPMGQSGHMFLPTSAATSMHSSFLPCSPLNTPYSSYMPNFAATPPYALMDYDAPADLRKEHPILLSSLPSSPSMVSSGSCASRRIFPDSSANLSSSLLCARVWVFRWHLQSHWRDGSLLL
jgi:hypothetical protein